MIKRPVRCPQCGADARKVGADVDKAQAHAAASIHDVIFTCPECRQQYRLEDGGDHPRPVALETLF